MLDGLHQLPLPDVDEVALDGGRGGHLRARRGACARRGPGGPRSCGSRSRRSARRAGGCPGSCPGTSSSRRCASRSRRRGRPRRAPRPRPGRPPAGSPGTTIAWTSQETLRPSTSAAAARRSPMRELVHEPMNTRSRRISCIGVPASRPMYLSARSSPSDAARAPASVTGDDHRGRRAPGDQRARARRRRRRSRGRSSRRRRCAARASRRRRPRSPPARRGAAVDPLEGRVVGRDHARAPAALDRHVADRHAALHRERLDRRAGVLDHVAGGAVDAHLADRAEDQVLGGDAEAELARRSGCASTSACAGRASGWRARARPRSCRCRTRARRTRRGWRCASRRRRSSCPAG